MAFTYCTNCGEKIDMENKQCPYCGYSLTDDYVYGREEQGDKEGSEKTYDSGYENVYNVPRHTPKRPLCVGMLVFSIINVFLAFPSCPTLFLGLIGMLFTFQARNAKTDKEEASKKRAALIINIVAAVLLTVFTVVYTFMYMEAIMQQYSEYLQYLQNYTV